MVNNLELLFLLGRPFSPLYGLAMKTRAAMYKKGVFRQHRLAVPVISIGNLVLGGTGKTPTVRHLAEFLLQRGYRPAIISRGYGGKAGRKVNLVSDGQSLLLSPDEAGDEPYMLADALPGVPVLTGIRRIFPCRQAVDEYQADILLLDDGFQHLAVRRDIDIILFDGSHLAGNSRIFPGGVLREPVSALSRSDAFLITGITEQNRIKAERFAGLLRSRFSLKPVFFAALDTCRVRCPDQRLAEAPPPEERFFAFCGIANPSRFAESLASVAILPTGFLALPDHLRYSQQLMNDICQKASASGAGQLITTQKDYVKIKDFVCPLPRNILEIRCLAESGFDLFITKALENLGATPRFSPAT